MSKRIDTVPEQSAAYLHANHKTQSVPQMAKALRHSAKNVYKFMAELGLEPRGKVVDKNHPFVKQNRKLRAVLIDERQQRAKLKAKS